MNYPCIFWFFICASRKLLNLINEDIALFKKQLMHFRNLCTSIQAKYIVHSFVLNSGFSTQSTQVTGLEEYWQYKFKVNAATGKGNTISEFSNNFRTLQAGES